MKAAFLVAPRRMEIGDAPEAPVGPHDVRLRPDAVGLCGTDFHIYSGESNYNMDAHGRPIPLDVQPLILGHEVMGTVEEVGAEVRDPVPGQRVVIDQGLNCHSLRRDPACEYCVTGDSHQCEHFREHGITGDPGGLAESLVIPAVNTVPIRTDRDRAEAVMTEPLGCVLHSCDMMRKASARYAFDAHERFRRIRNVLVCGAGPAGQLFVQVLRRVLGFQGSIIVSDPDPHKRQLAASWGSTPVDPTGTDLVEAVLTLTEGRRVECMVEATGSGPLFRQIPGLIRKQATLLLYGHGHGGIGMEALNQVQWREPTLVSPVGASGGFDQAHRPVIYRDALALIENGTIDVASLITNRYEGLDQVPAAFAGDHQTPGYLKGVALLG